VYISSFHRRLSAVFLLFLVFLGFCIVRLAYLQFFRSKYLSNLAQKQYNLFVELEPRRGAIFDANAKPQAVNIPADSLYACPNQMKESDKEAAVRQLAPILRVSQDYLRGRIYRKAAFIWLARKIDEGVAVKIRQLKIRGIDFIKESKRCYPNGYLAAQVMGFAGMDNTGLEGLELYYNRYLKGGSGWVLFLRDARQKKLDIWEKMVAERDGYTLTTTLDEVVQFIAERELEKAYRTYHAKGASIIVMDPHTGAILAMANRPTFDLNSYTSADKDQMRNRSICDLFEPGSVFKIVTAAAALEEKKVNEGDKFFCENGAYRVASHTLHDHRPHGWLTFREVIEQSSNIGTTKVAQVLGADIVYRYTKLFGFGAKTGIDLPGEISGMAKEPRFWSKISIAAIPIGQEIGVTALQLASAISVIANGGQLMKPYVVSEVKDKHGESIKKFSPTLIRKVISVETSLRLSSILTGVIENGTAKTARLKDYSAAGKTGTAQKLEADGTYSHSKFIASFIGFAPVEDPAIVIVVILDEPRPYYFGGVVAAPVFKNVATDVLKYLKISKSPLRKASAANELQPAN